MKEITFEELMHNKFDALEHYGGFKLSTKQQNAILELMQQVAKEKISECMEIIDRNEGSDVSNIFWRMNDIPTDRIKIDE